MRIIRAKDYEDMSRKAANIISSVMTLKPDCVLGLATGSSPVGTYKHLIRRYENGDLDFSRVTSVNLDEYKGLDRENSQSYYYFMRENLFSHVNIRMENTYIPDGTEADSEKACSAYNEILHKVGSVDLQLLGIGHDGHIGFNEPADTFAIFHANTKEGLYLPFSRFPIVSRRTPTNLAKSSCFISYLALYSLILFFIIPAPLFALSIPVSLK